RVRGWATDHDPAAKLPDEFECGVAGMVKHKEHIVGGIILRQQWPNVLQQARLKTAARRNHGNKRRVIRQRPAHLLAHVARETKTISQRFNSQPAGDGCKEVVEVHGLNARALTSKTATFRRRGRSGPA